LKRNLKTRTDFAPAFRSNVIALLQIYPAK